MNIQQMPRNSAHTDNADGEPGPGGAAELRANVADADHYVSGDAPIPAGTDAGPAVATAIDGLVALAIRGGPRDISLTAAATLATLERGGPCRLTDLAEIEGVAQPSMSTLVTSLERSGLAERRPSPDDGRVVLVTLTPAGADYLAARRRARAGRLAELIAMLPAGEAAALAAAVPAMTRLRDLEARRRAAGPEGRRAAS
jgi:DNA-binding MarR family transcriptional regulator